jgi:hypothetical protein
MTLTVCAQSKEDSNNGIPSKSKSAIMSSTRLVEMIYGSDMIWSLW